MVEGTLKGVYGKQQFPVAKLAIQVKDASAKYADLPYGIDKLTANFEACVDLMRQHSLVPESQNIPLQGCAYRCVGRWAG